VAWTDDPYGSGTSRVISGDLQANPEFPLGQWNHGEADVYGADSGVFILNGQVRTRGRNFRLGAGGGNPASRIPCSRGNIGLQAEGYALSFRNWEIMELDSATGLPLHARKGCTNRADANYDPRAVVDDGTCSATALARPTGQGLGFAANPGGRARLAFPEGATRVQFFDLRGRPFGTYRRDPAGFRFPADAPRGVLVARFLP
jgi:hypothetical protein